MSVVTMSITGLDRLRYILSQSKALAAQALAAGLYEEALVIFNKTQRVVPVRYGFLRASGYVTPPTMGLTWAEVTIGYGGAAAPYAYWVHERTFNYRTGRPVRHDAPTKAKYLEDPVLEAAKTFDARLTKRVSTRIFASGMAA